MNNIKSNTKLIYFITGMMAQRIITRTYVAGLLKGFEAAEKEYKEA